MSPSRVPHNELTLVIDQGGQSSRALVFDRSGRRRASASVPVPTRRPRSGWVEQDPLQIVASVHRCLDEVAAALGASAARVRAAGLATQRSSVVCWDRLTGEPLSPVLSWQDCRGQDQIRDLRSCDELVRQTTGLLLSAHYGASKIRWCLDHLPRVEEAGHRDRLAAGPLASFLLHRLCAERPLLVDPAIAARTLLWDPATADWSPRLLELFGVPRELLPASVPSRHDYGRIALGEHAIPLIVSTGDQSAALFFEGTPAEDVAFVNLGTGAFVQRPTQLANRTPAGLLRSLVWHDGKSARYALEGSINGCGSALELEGSRLGLDESEVIARARSWLARSGEPPLFLNGVSGLGSPYWVADYPTGFLGTGEPWERMVAVMESVLFLVRINLAAMSDELGAPRRVSLAGGLAGIDGLCQRLANLIDADVERSPVREATALGLAFLVEPSIDVVGTAGGTDRFRPRVDPGLQDRFARWREALESRLPA